MRFFDYKFIILLGLALVIYFIYREVEYIRTRIDKIEQDISENKQLCESKMVQVTQPVQKVAHQASPSPSPPVSPKPKLSPKAPTPPPPPVSVQVPNFQSYPVIADVSSTEYESDSDMESDSSTSTSSEHVAIYSNDNENFEETEQTLVASAESNKMQLAFDYDASANNKTKSSESSDEELIKLTKNVDFLKVSENPVPQAPVQQDEVQVETSPVEVVEEVVEEKQKQTFEDLDRLKLPEIKKMAENKNITLTKKVNGQQKPKTKKELIDELLLA